MTIREYVQPFSLSNKEFFVMPLRGKKGTHILRNRCLNDEAVIFTSTFPNTTRGVKDGRYKLYISNNKLYRIRSDDVN